MRVYTGRRSRSGNAIVRRIDDDGEAHALRLRLDLARHSPTGFEYGYGGSGPAQLALAILADVLGDDAIALNLHQQFKHMIIAPLKPSLPWQLTEDFVRNIAMVLLADRIIEWKQAPNRVVALAIAARLLTQKQERKSHESDQQTP